jgi:hypothetical protein
MALITQAEFARRKNVTRAAVSQWKSEGRLKLVRKLIDFEATEAAMIPGASYRSKRRIPARQGDVNPMAPLNADNAPAAPLGNYPAAMSALVTGGASDMAVVLLRSKMPRDRVATVVQAWLSIARHSATELLTEDLDAPPGVARWADHPAFQESWLASTSWAELEAEAALPSGQEG